MPIVERRRRPRRRRRAPALRRLHRPRRRPARPSRRLARRRAVDRRRHRRQPVARDRPARRGRRSRHPPARPTRSEYEPHRRHRRRRPPRAQPRRGLAGAGHELVSLDRAHLGRPELPRTSSRSRSTSTGCRGHRRARRRAGRRASIHLAAIAVPFSAPEDVILRTNAALALVGARRCGGGRHPEDRRRVEPDGARLRGARRAGCPTASRSTRRPRHARGTPTPCRSCSSSRRSRCSQRQTGDAIRFAAFRPCYVIAPEEWAGAPTQQGHTVRERLDDPALSAPGPVQLRRCAGCRDLRRRAARRPRRHPERRGVLRRRRRCARPRAARRAAPAVPSRAPASRRRGAHRHRARLLEREGAAAARLAPPTRLAHRTRPRADDTKGRRRHELRRHPLLPGDPVRRARPRRRRPPRASTSRRTLAHAPGGVFPACGTGEFHALSAAEAATVVRVAVETVAGAVPVVAGSGRAARARHRGRPRGRRRRCGRAARAAALPRGRPAGRDSSAYVEAIAAASALPVVDLPPRHGAVLGRHRCARLAAEPEGRRLQGRRRRHRHRAADRARGRRDRPRRLRVLQRPADRRAHPGRVPGHRHPAVLVGGVRDGPRDRERVLPRLRRRRRGAPARAARRLLRAARARCATRRPVSASRSSRPGCGSAACRSAACARRWWTRRPSRRSASPRSSTQDARCCDAPIVGVRRAAGARAAHPAVGERTSRRSA